MMQLALFKEGSPLAARQPKTDRLILARLLKAAGDDQRLDPAAIDAAHAILIRWADSEKMGRLTDLTETQLQGAFLHEVFGDALGYTRPVENQPVWHLEQHFPIEGQTPDAVLGRFEQGLPKTPSAVVELKGTGVHLDRDRSNGRTAVDQCWDYLVNTPPSCRWGIVSNLISFRLYERNSTKRAYEHFTLQELRKPEVFRQFYALFHRKGLVEPTAGVPPRAIGLLEESRNRQRTVSDELYETYSKNRADLIAFLIEQNHSVNEAIEMAQRLFDRIVFIAFCEDRELLPEQTIATALKVSGFHAATNPKWENFKNLFRFIDLGEPRHGIEQYNGGLFAPHSVDDLDLPDEPWATFFNSIGSYDFGDEVNLDVLGHLFERSITELEKLKASALFGGNPQKVHEYARMPQSAKRKQLGIYYTPPELTSRIVQYTVGELIDERFAALAVTFGISQEDAQRRIMPSDEAFWRGCLEILRHLKIVDPACGSGAFLFQAYSVLEHRYFEVIGHLDRAGADDADELSEEVPVFILNENLYGVDLSPEAVEITQLALWIRSATPGQTLATLSRNIVHGNSLVHDNAHHPHGFNWQERFPEVFSGDRPLSRRPAMPRRADTASKGLSPRENPASIASSATRRGNA